MRRAVIVAAIVVAGCASDSTVDPSPAEGCTPSIERAAGSTLRCVHVDGVITAAQLTTALEAVERAEETIDSLEQPMGGADDQYYRASWIRNALSRFAEYHVGGALRDSARVARLVDAVRVNAEFAVGRLRRDGERVFPALTPHLTWVFYPSIGVYFQPVTTIENAIGIPLPSAEVSTDTMLAIGEAMWRYATWRSGPKGKFVVWEYNFSFLSDVQKRAPWVSSLAQGEALKLYVELYRRTGDPRHADRAAAVFGSFRTLWSDGGILVDDTTRGYWWDEYDPRMRTWNGSMAALVAVGLYADVVGQSTVLHAAARGREAAKYWTPYFDTGEWTTYSLLAGYVSPGYQRWHVMLADALFQQTQDPFWSDTRDRWGAYTPPPGLIDPPVLPNEAARLPHLEVLLRAAGF
jgi:hypothetical protein